MAEPKYISITDFAEKAGVSKQAIYKQVNNENSQLAPFVRKEGKRTLISIEALRELYRVDISNLTFTTQPEGERVENQPAEVERQPIEVETENAQTTSQPTPDNPKINQTNPISTPDFQPISADYIAFLKAEIAELKEDKAQMEERLNATIQEKDSIIKDQSAQLAELARQVAQIADRALIATSQQQYLTAMEKGERAEPAPAEEPPIVEQTPSRPKRGFWNRLFNI